MLVIYRSPAEKNKSFLKIKTITQLFKPTIPVGQNPVGSQPQTGVAGFCLKVNHLLLEGGFLDQRRYSFLTKRKFRQSLLL